MSSPERRTKPLLALLCVLTGPAWGGAAVAQSGTVGAKMLTDLVERSVLAQVAQAPMAQGARRLEVVAGTMDSRLSLGACDLPIAVEADLSREQPRVNARVSCSAPSPWSIYVPVDIRIFRPVLVADRALQRGDTLGRGDVKIEERNALTPGALPLSRPEEVEGYTARRPIPANSVLTASLIELPVLVRRGDRVSVRSRAGGISVQISAEALGDARSGERVRVRNSQSGKLLDAVVTGPGTAEVM